MYASRAVGAAQAAVEPLRPLVQVLAETWRGGSSGHNREEKIRACRDGLIERCIRLQQTLCKQIKKGCTRLPVC